MRPRHPAAGVAVQVGCWNRAGGDGQTSATAFEIAAADAANIPVLPFQADDNWPGRLWDDDPAARSRPTGPYDLNRSAKFFHFENDPKLPDFPVAPEGGFRQLSDAGGGPSAVTARAPGGDAASGADRRVSASPAYPLLSPLRKHPRTFAGRDARIATLAGLVGHPALVLCVHASSGAGKSSVLFAGLAPRLRSDGYTASASIRRPAIHGSGSGCSETFSCRQRVSLLHTRTRIRRRRWRATGWPMPTRFRVPPSSSSSIRSTTCCGTRTGAPRRWRASGH